MATWDELTAAAPDLATALQGRFEAHIHSLLATLRCDGSPRLSGIETTFVQGELWLGMTPGSRKAADLRRDPRFALHSAPADEQLTGGDAKVAGRALEATDADGSERYADGHEGAPRPGDLHLFRLDVIEATFLTVVDYRLVVESWHQDLGLRRLAPYEGQA